MTDIEVDKFPNDVYDNPDTIKDSENSANAQNDNIKAVEAGESKVECEKLFETAQTANINLLDTISKVAKTELSESDKIAIKEFNEFLRTFNFLTGDIDKFRELGNKISPDGQKFLSKNIRTLQSSYNDYISKNFTNKNTTKKIEESRAKTAGFMKTIDEELSKDKPDGKVIQDATESINKEVKSTSDEIEKTESSVARKTKSYVGDKIWEIIKFFTVLGAIVGGAFAIWVIAKAIADNLTGCYMYINEKGGDDSAPTKYKLEGCSKTYYSNTATSANCKCGNTVPIGTKPITSNMCQTNTECTLPYCLKSCAPESTDSSILPCTNFGQNNQPLQCTTGNLKDKGYVYYAYLEYSPLDILTSGINGLLEIPGALLGGAMDLLKKILIYGGIIILSIFLLLIIWGIIKKYVIKT